MISYAYAVPFGLNRNFHLSDKRVYNLVLASVIYNVIDILIVLLATPDSTLNALCCMPVILHIILAVSIGYLSLGKKVSQQNEVSLNYSV